MRGRRSPARRLPSPALRARTLKGVFGSARLNVTVHIHALIMSAWCLVFIAQTWLVAARRVVWHRRLGVVAALLAVLLIAMGAGLTLAGVAREGRIHTIGKFHYLLGINLVNLLLFGGLIGAALALRHRPAVHKRLMLLAAVTLLAPAVARLALLFTHRPLAQFLAFYAAVAACILFDTVRHRRLHPVLAWAALLVIGAFHLTFLAVQSRAWMALVTRLFG
jgi:hypothetical protein